MKRIISCQKHLLQFKKPAKTSRNTIAEKPLWVVKVANTTQPDVVGIGEISPFPGLSLDDRPHFELFLNEMIDLLAQVKVLDEMPLQEWPSIRFGFETALADLLHGGKGNPFPGKFAEGLAKLPINGLIWMDDIEGMWQQTEQKILEGYTCVKMKIGALDFDAECRLLERIRKKYPAGKIMLRVDANGAFNPDDALAQLKDLSRFELHSIEQPIAVKQWDLMEELCAKSPLAIALDEELIGVGIEQSLALLKKVKPQYLILKPGILGGFEVCKRWIDLANRLEIPWWITSALESNIGLNAIAQFTALYPVSLPQGLGTGALYKENFPSRLSISSGWLMSQPSSS